MAPHQSPYLQRALEKYNAFDMLKESKLCSKSRLNRNCLKQSKHSMLANRRMGKIQKDKKKPWGAKGKDKGKTKFAYAPKPKISPPPKRDNPKKDYACHPCKEVGYWRRNFPSYHAELKKRKNASRASTSDRLKKGITTIVDLELGDVMSGSHEMRLPVGIERRTLQAETWIEHSQEANIGKDQQDDVYWNLIMEDFNSRTTAPPRTKNMMIIDVKCDDAAEKRYEAREETGKRTRDAAV
ncbi:hypothetical protein Tco_1401352 [Tanacetum coccineum]